MTISPPGEGGQETDLGLTLNWRRVSEPLQTVESYPADLHSSRGSKGPMPKQVLTLHLVDPSDNQKDPSVSFVSDCCWGEGRCYARKSLQALHSCAEAC